MASMTIAQIKAQMTDAFIAEATIRQLYNLDESKTFEEQFSKVSLESIIFYIVAAAMWSLQNLWSIFQQEVDETIVKLKPHSLSWYRDRVVEFRYGQTLMNDSDRYSDDGLLPEYIDHMKIVAQAAVIEILDRSQGSRLRIKAVKDTGELVPLTPDELSSLTDYIARVKDAGVPVQVDSLPADSLQLTYDIWYDPLVVNTNGSLINDSSVFPAKDTIYLFLRELNFNGEFRLASLTDALQSTPGIIIPELKAASSRYGAMDYVPIDAKVVPDAGYLKIINESSDLVLNYRAYEQ